jgi:hypothetical protein
MQDQLKWMMRVFYKLTVARLQLGEGEKGEKHMSAEASAILDRSRGMLSVLFAERRTDQVTMGECR